MKHLLSAIAHIRFMIGWFESQDVNRWDLALRRRDGAFIAQGLADLDQDHLHRCLGWVRHSNAQGAEVYIRPARRYAWPMLFFDDVQPSMAQRIARAYATMIVRTSYQGGCHLWLRLTRPLDESLRYQVQASLQPIIGADPGSISGEHWGRLAGTKNHKRGGQWTGILDATSATPYNPEPALSPPQRGRRVASSATRSHIKHDRRDESVAEFAWCCRQLRNGVDLDALRSHIESRAHKRGKRNPAEYAKRTLLAAMKRCWQT